MFIDKNNNGIDDRLESIILAKLRVALKRIEQEYGISNKELCYMINDEIDENPHLEIHRDNPHFWNEVIKSKHKNSELYLQKQIKLAKEGKLSDIELGDLILCASGLKQGGVW